ALPIYASFMFRNGSATATPPRVVDQVEDLVDVPHRLIRLIADRVDALRLALSERLRGRGHLDRAARLGAKVVLPLLLTDLQLLVVVDHGFDAVLAPPLTQLGDDRPPKELAEILLAVNLRHQRGTVHAATAALAHVGDPLTSLRVEVAAVTETARDDQL